MIITLIGYMGSGKSLISKPLSEKSGYKEIDLDFEISQRNHLSINDIFQEKGELFFRKQEKMILEEILNTKNDLVLSVGGGTPCYYNNIDLINEKSESIYLMANVSTLVENLLGQKDSRPLLAKIPDYQLPEFIGQHLFERNQFYQQAKHIISVDNWDTERIIQDILNKIKKEV